MTISIILDVADHLVGDVVSILVSTVGVEQIVVQPAAMLPTVHHAVVDTVMAADDNFGRLYRRQMRDERRAYYESIFDQVIMIACPTCGVGADHLCVTASGKPKARPSVHMARRRAFEAPTTDTVSEWVAF